MRNTDCLDEMRSPQRRLSHRSRFRDLAAWGENSGRRTLPGHGLGIYTTMTFRSPLVIPAQVSPGNCAAFRIAACPDQGRLYAGMTEKHLEGLSCVVVLCRVMIRSQDLHYRVTRWIRRLTLKKNVHSTGLFSGMLHFSMYFQIAVLLKTTLRALWLSAKLHKNPQFCAKTTTLNQLSDTADNGLLPSKILMGSKCSHLFSLFTYDKNLSWWPRKHQAENAVSA